MTHLTVIIYSLVQSNTCREDSFILFFNSTGSKPLIPKGLVSVFPDFGTGPLISYSLAVGITSDGGQTKHCFFQNPLRNICPDKIKKK